LPQRAPRVNLDADTTPTSSGINRRNGAYRRTAAGLGAAIRSVTASGTCDQIVPNRPRPVGYEGYHYLTNRASFMIIFGGVNIYPQEIENELIMHPKVEDVTVIGVPHQASSTSAMRTSTSKSALFTAPDCAVGLSHEAKVREALLRHLFRL
jgi:acyl-CoA synthetase (AMP-forming)/AMP-acid ligase II